MRRLLADQRGTVFVEHSSLVLLLAVAAVAVLAQTGGVDKPAPHAEKRFPSTRGRRHRLSDARHAR